MFQLHHYLDKYFTVDNMRLLKVGRRYADKCTETEEHFGMHFSPLEDLDTELAESWRE